MTLLYIVLGISAALVLFVIFSYNRFVSLTNRVKEAWSDIDIQLKRRYDLIPNLVETVKGYMTHERATLDSVTLARSKAMNASAPAEKAAAENVLSGTLKTLFALSENYPDLKANTNFLELQRELSDTENKIQAARRFYNSVVQDLQNALQSFPSNLIGSTFGFQARDFFALDENQTAAREPIKVSF